MKTHGAGRDDVSIPFVAVPQRDTTTTTGMSDTSDYVTLDQVEQLLAEQRAELTAEFEARFEAKDERIAELEACIDDLESSHELTQSTVWELEDVVTGEYDFSHPHLQGDSVIDRIDDIEGRLEASNPQGDGGETTLHNTVGEDWEPIERNALMDDDDLEEHCGPSDRRATILFKNWGKWSTKVQAGNILKTCDSLKQLLSAACDESLSWKQTYRACAHLERLSKGAIVFTDHKKHGKMLKQTRPFASKQATNAGVTSSSVA